MKYCDQENLYVYGSNCEEAKEAFLKHVKELEDEAEDREL